MGFNLKFTNFATSTIADAGGIASGDLAVNVSSGDGALFPSLTGDEYFYCVLVDSSANREVVKVTARSSDAFTIVRAQDNTNARAFAQGDKIELRITACQLEELQEFEPDTNVAAFKQNSAPTGWTRDATMQDNAMLCYAASGDPASGGAVNPQSTHQHAVGTLQFTVASISSDDLRFYDISGSPVIFTTGVDAFDDDIGGSFDIPYVANPTLSNATFYTASGAGSVAANASAPYYQEVIAATKDA